MEFHAILKGVLMGFVMSMGMQTLAFYSARFFSGIPKEHFAAVFMAAAIASFSMVCGVLVHEFHTSSTPELGLLMAACAGGWLVGILLGLTYAKPLLIRLWR